MEYVGYSVWATAYNFIKIHMDISRIVGINCLQITNLNCVLKVTVTVIGCDVLIFISCAESAITVASFSCF